MKSQSDVQKRLRKLKLRYLKNYLKISQDRVFGNCVHGHLHNPSPIPQKPKFIEEDLVPRHQVTLVVLQNEELGNPVPLCMYGSDNPNAWSGDMCLGDTPVTCQWFKPRVPLEDADAKFIELLEDDEYVYDNMKDIAALQWVVNERIAFWRLSLVERIIIWFTKTFFRYPKILPSPPINELTGNIWDDTTEDP